MAEVRHVNCPNEGCEAQIRVPGSERDELPAKGAVMVWCGVCGKWVLGQLGGEEPDTAEQERGPLAPVPWKEPEATEAHESWLK